VVTAPGAPTIAFQGLAAAYRNLDAAGQQRIRSLGTRSSAPIHVPEIGTEYFWVRTFGCEGGSARVKMQALISSDKGPLEPLFFVCADGAERSLYFDFSADPMEKEMRKELEHSAGPT
jgi:hypothetical protein